jgi:hypothetical protein
MFCICNQTLTLFPSWVASLFVTYLFYQADGSLTEEVLAAKLTRHVNEVDTDLAMEFVTESGRRVGDTSPMSSR